MVRIYICIIIKSIYMWGGSYFIFSFRYTLHISGVVWGNGLEKWWLIGQKPISCILFARLICVQDSRTWRIVLDLNPDDDWLLGVAF